MRRIAIVVALLGALALSGCCSAPQPAAQSSAPAAASGGTFAVITHAGPGDSFWDVVKNGAEAAGKQYAVKVTYQGDGDPAKQSQLIDQAVSEKVDGVVVSMANPDALQEAIGKAVAAKIAVVTINSGADSSQAFGAITHVRSEERHVGRGAGEQLKAAG